jgi:hypothetical protein
MVQNQFILAVEHFAYLLDQCDFVSFSFLESSMPATYHDLLLENLLGESDPSHGQMQWRDDADECHTCITHNTLMGVVLFFAHTSSGRMV